MSETMLRFEPVDTDSSQWTSELNDHHERTIFQTPAWLSFLAITQKAQPVVAALKHGHQSLGYFTGLIVRKFGIRILGSPFPGWTTSYMGLCLSGDIPRRSAMEALTCFAFEDLHCAHLEIMDRYLTLADIQGLGFQHRSFLGFEIDLTQSEDQLLARMSSACRRCIRKAEKSGVVIEQAHDLAFADDYYAQLRDVFAKQFLVPPYGVERVRELIKHISPTGMLLLLRARGPDGHCIATGIFPAMNQTMYFWGGASWRDSQIFRPNELIQWYAIKHWKKHGIQVYDMGGGGEYKKKYGGYEIVVPWCRKSKYRSISHMRDVAQQIFRARQHLVGTWRHCISSR